MKNLKKLMSVILTVAMLMSLVVSTSAATFTDVAETDNAYEAVEVLAALDILEGKDANNFDPDANIKRSEFAAVVCRAMNAEAAAAGSASAKFTDVAANHWAAGYIAWAADAEIVNGRGDGTFDPDANVTYQEAAKMIVAAMGWGPYAENKGGFPTGYMTVANTYDLMAGIDVANYGAAADRKGVAQLVYNSFDAPLLDTEKIYFGDEPEYTIFDGKGGNEKRTLLSQYHDIYKIKAIVADTYKSDEELYDKKGSKIAFDLVDLYKYNEDDVEKSTGMNFVGVYNDDDELIGKTFTILDGGAAVADLLGYTVDVYVAANDDDKAEVVALVAANEIDELVIENPAEFVKAADETKVEYWESLSDVKAAKAKLASTVAVYVNGVAAEDVEVADYADYDKMVLVGEDEVYNKVLFTAYEYGVIDEIDAEYYEVTLKDGTVLNFDAAVQEDNEDAHIVNIYKDGVAIDFEDLAEGDLLNVVANKALDSFDDDGALFADIYVTNNVVEGTVETVEDDEVYVIDGEEYFLCDGVDALNPGDTGKFVLTITGTIYSYDLTEVTSGNYGLVINAGVKAGVMAGEDDVVYIKLVDKNNKVATYELKDNAYVTGIADIDGVMTDDDKEALIAALVGDVDAQEFALAAEESLVTFRAADGVISDLAFLAVEAEIDGNYSAKSKKLDGNLVNDATVVFHIINDDVENVQVYSATTLKVKDADEEAYAGFAYDKDSKRVIGAVILTNDMPFVGAEDPLAVVMSISTGLDSEGYRTSVLNYYQAGEVKSLAKANVYMDEEDDWSALAAGDVIQIATNAAGEINDIEVILADGEVVADEDGVYEYVYGVVADKEASYIEVDGVEYDFDIEGTNVLWDTEKTIKKGLETKSGISYLKAPKSYNKTVKVEGVDTEGEETTSYYVLLKVEADETTALEVVSYKVVSWEATTPVVPAPAPEGGVEA